MANKYHHFQAYPELGRSIASAILYFLDSNHKTGSADRHVWISTDQIPTAEQANEILNNFIQAFLDDRHSDIEVPGSQNSKLPTNLGRLVNGLARHIFHINGTRIASYVSELILRYEGMVPRSPEKQNLLDWEQKMLALKVQEEAGLVGHVAALVKRYWYYPPVSDRKSSQDPFEACRDWARRRHSTWFAYALTNFSA